MQSVPVISLEDVPLSMLEGEGNGGGKGGQRGLDNEGFETVCTRRSNVHDRRISARLLVRCRILRPLRLLLRNMILLHFIHCRSTSPGNADAPSTAASITLASAMAINGNRATHSQHGGRSIFPQKQRHGELSATETFVEVDDEDDGGVLETYEDVLDNFGGEMVGDSIPIQTRKKEKEIDKLKNGFSFSGSRLDWLIYDDNQVGGLRLISNPLSTLTVSRRSTVTVPDSVSDGSEGRYDCPPEWEALEAGAKAKLATLLSWENLSRWDFDIVELARMTRNPLLLVGWALLCPTAQEAMHLSLGLEEERIIKSYNFHEHITIDPRKVCNFLREVEKRYKHDNPFHSNIHAADVTQTTHCLFQLIDEKLLSQICDPVMIFCLLLAAAFHDVGHPGTNNLFEQNAMTPLAIRYNGISILENMHSAIGNSLLFGEKKREEWDVFGGWSLQQKVRARNIMTGSILGTDMSNHFTELDALRGKLEKLRNPAPREGDESESILSMLGQTLGSSDDADKIEECNKFICSSLKFLLHAADISNQAKKEKLAVYWADGALAEFFAQGDKEKEMGLPVSPLCDRDTVKRHDSQIAFIEFVTRPTFELLGEIIPRVSEEVMPGIESNLEYWESDKSKQSQSVRK